MRDPSEILAEEMADSVENLRLKAELAGMQRQAVAARELLLEAQRVTGSLKGENARLAQANFNMSNHLMSLRESVAWFFIPGWLKRSIVSEVGKR